ncbi:MAG: hypothetical protein ABI197_03395 [Granulicella sp.]
MGGWRSRGKIAAVVLLGVVMVGLPACAASARQAYADRANGVSFSYPGDWLLNGDDDAATAKLRITSVASALAVVQLEGNFADEGPYKGTDFEAGAFAYTVLSNSTEAQCFATLDASSSVPQKPVIATWKGLPSRRLEAHYGIAGTNDAHQMVAVYRQGKCYLLETVIVSRDPGDVTRPLAPVQWKAIRAQFAGVLRSVTIS